MFLLYFNFLINKNFLVRQRQREVSSDSYEE